MKIEKEKVLELINARVRELMKQGDRLMEEGDKEHNSDKFNSARAKYQSAHELNFIFGEINNLKED